jgi:hypothetical protein
MADDRNIRGAADRSRINMQEDYEVRYWTEKWSVTREQLAAAIRAVGVMVKDVAAKLGKAPSGARAHTRRHRSPRRPRCRVWPPYDWAVPTLGPLRRRDSHRNGFRSPDSLCHPRQPNNIAVRLAGVGSVSAYRATARMAGLAGLRHEHCQGDELQEACGFPR